uniref:Uncharacterized protein n=1 Tax=Favella ehrenbergii TaxID=182087 RepID=A0A7S3MPL4_9SPIT|eukprot:CAMPEP_0170454990 /NCGR_PEP_ID=MMETSP0123-20130129/3070_1 /TAXON_ID=182087 /ORGANISM="Favella ehrenbergii, Strain Fehren 1" /LENGTH=139 /DNA_ID=CAMNT_0010717911 /DNA_START=831 /DNA_END=1250 /DNA_ORIENTATION=-
MQVDESVVVEREVLAATFFDSLLCDVDHGLVEAVVEALAEVELFPDGLEHRAQGHISRLLDLARLIREGFGPLAAIEGAQSNLSEPILFFENALLRNEDFVDGLGRGVVDLGGDGSLADAPSILVDEFHEQVALLVRHF